MRTHLSFLLDGDQRSSLLIQTDRPPPCHYLRPLLYLSFCIYFTFLVAPGEAASAVFKEETRRRDSTNKRVSRGLFEERIRDYPTLPQTREAEPKIHACPQHYLNALHCEVQM